METRLDQQGSQAPVPATPLAGRTRMEIKPNHKTFVRIDTPLAKVAPAVGTLFHRFHSQLSDWRAERLADLQCEAHVRGVTYMTRQGAKAFIWINFGASGLTVMVPGVDPSIYRGAKATTNTPGQIRGALLKVATPSDIPIAIQAIQDAYAAPKL